MKEFEHTERIALYNERFVRWQQLSIAQLSFSNNLILVLDLGFMGFLISQSGLTFSSNCWILFIQIISFIGLGSSFLVGIIVVLNRLKDFHETSQLIRKRSQLFRSHNKKVEKINLDANNQQLLNLKNYTDKLGKRTWSLFKLQLWTFACGTLLGVIYLIIVNNIGG